MKNCLQGLLLVVLSLIPYVGRTQIEWQAHAGVGYTEHLSIGAGCKIAGRHGIAIFYGTDFFVRPKSFSSYLLQYNFSIPAWKVAGMIPSIGIKGGQNIYTDHYYRWKVALLIPFLEIQRPLNEKWTLGAQGGCAFSFEQSVTRIRYGEIGHYRERLPEVRIGIVYKITSNL